MAVTFAVRGTQLDAWYSTNGKYWRSKRDSGASLPAVLANGAPGIFGGSVIDVFHATQSRAIVWPAWNNWSRNAAFAVLVRIVPTFNGFPPDDEAVFGALDANNSTYGGLQIKWNSDGTFTIAGKTEFGSNIISFLTPSYTAVAGQAFDLMVSWDGVTTTNGVKVGIDGVLFHQANAADTWANYSSDRGRCPVTSFMVGVGPGASGVANFRINEIVCFDNAQSVVYTARTNFWSISQLDATEHTDPGEAHVESGVTYTSGGLAKTGTLVKLTNILTQATLIGQAPPSTSAVVLELTQGDSIALNLKALNGPNGTAFDLTGASFTTYVKGENGAVVEIPDADHEADPDQVTNTGVFVCNVSAAKSALFKVGTKKEIVTKVSVGADVIYFHGVQALVVLSPTPIA